MMRDSTSMKRENKMQIWKLLIGGESYTKQQIAQQTGLSVASCNTYLNEMERTGEVIGEKQKSHDVGRNAVVYQLNEAFESILCIYFELIQNIKSITAAVLSPLEVCSIRKCASMIYWMPLSLRKTLLIYCSNFPM